MLYLLPGDDLKNTHKKTYIVAIVCLMSSCFQTFLYFCENNCFHIAIAAFVHIRNFLVQLSVQERPPAPSMNETYTAQSV